MKKHMNIPIFIPHLGCTHACAFCSQRSVTNKEAAPSPESVAFSIRESLATANGRDAEVAFFGGSFTGIPKKEQTAYLEAVQPFLSAGTVESIRISTRPDLIDGETVRFLRELGVKTVELGAQSMDDEVLAETRRGHTAEDTRRAAACILEGGLSLGLQMMTGLPSSTKEKEIYTAEEFVRLGAACARIYPTVVFYDTALYEAAKSGAYTPPTLSDTVERAAAALSVLEDGGVDVIRIGLMQTETLEAKIAAGAYHPAIGEMVRARRWRAKLESAMGELGGKEITVFCPKQRISCVLGQKRENFIYLAEKYGVRLQLGHTDGPVYVTDGEKTLFL